jgi:prepilin-type N-terminal cleavage/methylation domain-containing protein
MNHDPIHSSAGFTLIEAMVVIALSAIVTLGIVSFYLSAQQTWTDASAQALAQRDATTILATLSERARAADTAIVIPSTLDPQNSVVILYQRGIGGIKLESARFFCGRDGLMHEGDQDLQDAGPMTASKVLRFHATFDPSLELVTVDSLRVSSTTGQVVTQSTSSGLYN